MPRKKKISFQWFHGSSKDESEIKPVYIRINFLRQGTMFTFYSLNNRTLRLDRETFQKWELENFRSDLIEGFSIKETLQAYENILRFEYELNGKLYKLVGFSERIMDYFARAHTVLSKYMEVTNSINSTIIPKSIPEIDIHLAQTVLVVAIVTGPVRGVSLNENLSYYSWKFIYSDNDIKSLLRRAIELFNKSKNTPYVDWVSYMFDLQKEEIEPTIENIELYLKLIDCCMKLKQEDIVLSTRTTISENL